MEQPLQTENFSDQVDRLKNESCQRDLHAHMCVHMHECSNSHHNDSSTNVSHSRVMGWLHGARSPAQLHSKDQSCASHKQEQLELRRFDGCILSQI